MNPSRVRREALRKLTDLPNIGSASAQDLERLGIHLPQDLVGQDPFEMYERLCWLSGQRHDPCVIDLLISITRFMAGEPPRPWWDYTAERKRLLAEVGPQARP